MPLLAALSRALMACTTASAEVSLPPAISACADLTYVFKAVRTGLLRARLRADERISLECGLDIRQVSLILRRVYLSVRAGFSANIEMTIAPSIFLYFFA